VTDGPPKGFTTLAELQPGAGPEGPQKFSQSQAAAGQPRSRRRLSRHVSLQHTGIGEPQILPGHPALRRRSVAERPMTVTLGDVYL
jgi:hypothetical protein